MKVPSISNITKPIKKGLAATMIAAPAAGTLQSCESMAIAMANEMDRYMYHMPYYRPVPPPPVNVYHFGHPVPPPKPPVAPINKPPMVKPPMVKPPMVKPSAGTTRPKTSTRPSDSQRPATTNRGQSTTQRTPKTHVNQHGDTFQRGGR